MSNYLKMFFFLLSQLMSECIVLLPTAESGFGDGPRALRGAPVNGGGFGAQQSGFGKHCVEIIGIFRLLRRC